MKTDPQRLDRWVDSISDGEDLDWSRAEGVIDAPDDADLRALRDVARIAEFSRERQRGADDGAPAASLEAARWGELLLLERVGTGRHGEVWRAWDPRLQREVALKLMRPEAAGAGAATEASPLLAEARSLASVRHPNVVTVHGIAAHDGRVGVWMDFLRGPTLEAEIERRGALPLEMVREVGLQLAGALAALHRAGLLHRDVKPANVVIEPDGRAVLTDLSLGSHRLRPGEGPDRISGTPLFMAPERLAGGNATPASDVYALGVLLRWSLTGRAPYEAATLAELEAESKRGPRRPLVAERTDAPGALVRTIERAMAVDPAARFATAEAMAAELASRPAAVSGPRRSLRIAFAALGVVVVALAVGLALRRPAAPPASTPERAAPPVVAVSAAYDVGATLVRRSGGGFQRLASGDRVGPGDRLSLEFHASRPAYVYVVSEDERGASFLLFPQPLFDQSNPVPADSTVVLPGRMDGAESAWTVTSRGGREHFLVIASPQPVADIEAVLASMPAARPGRAISYATLARGTVERLRGVGGVATLPPDDSPRRSGAVARLATLAGRDTNVKGVWVREVTLENPVR